jgi:glycosyltransferase involved in cell wall biosynthesis
MRILHVMAGAQNGGAETYSTDMMQSLGAAGLTQRLVVPAQSIHHARLVESGAQVSADVLSLPLGPIRRWRMRRLIADFKPDLVHCWMRRAASLVAPQSVPVIGWFGGYYDPADFVCASHFVGVTEGLVQHMIEKGVAAGRAHYVPTFPTLDDAPPVTRAALDTPADAIVLLALARLHEKKALDVLLRALVDLPQCVAWIAGDGPLETELKTLATTLGVADRVRWLGWRTDRGALLRGADICVMPSRWEPFGNVMLEAWAAATPLVVAAAQGPKALIRDGANGMIVPIDDTGALAAAIARVIREPALKQTIVAGGTSDYRRAFTREAVTLRMITVYEQIISDSHAAQTSS